MPQWKGSNRKSRLPVDWARLRKVVLERSDYHCEWIEDGQPCYSRATDVDHIVSGDLHTLDNLQSLCGPHHRRKSSQEGRAAQEKLKALRTRPAEPQPGLIDGPPIPTEHRGF